MGDLWKVLENAVRSVGFNAGGRSRPNFAFSVVCGGLAPNFFGHRGRSWPPRGVGWRQNAMRRLILGFALWSIACGGESPTSATPQTVSVVGTWDYTARLSKTDGGSCVAVTLSSINLDTAMTMQANQVGGNVSAAVSGTNVGLGRSPDMACSYSGTADATSISITAPACPAFTAIIRCFNGVMSEITLNGSILTATVRGGTMEGTQTDTYNVKTVSTGVGAGAFTITYSFTATRR